MRRVHFKPAGAALLVLAATAAGWTSQASDAARRPARPAAAPALRGVNIAGVHEGSSPAEADREIAMARKLHANVVRIEVAWSVMEPRAAGEIAPRPLAFLDRLAQDAAANGIRIIMIVDSTPCWASSAPRALRRGCTPTHGTKANSWPPEVPDHYAAFMGYLAQRYGPNLAALEVWNEPDQINEHYFAGPRKAERYAAILRAAYRAIKQANPSVPVLGGSLVGSNGVFLRALYAAGIKGSYDGLAVHFYTLTIASLREIREVQNANGDGAPLWLDEFGWSSCWPHYRIQQEQSCVTRQIQATNLSEVVRSLARIPYVAATVVYKLQGSSSEDFGVLTASGGRKPAFGALASALARPLPARSAPVTLRLGREGSSVSIRGSAPPGDFMRTEVFQGGVLRFWAVFTLDRFNRYSFRLPPQLGTHGMTVRLYQFGAPGRATQRGI